MKRLIVRPGQPGRVFLLAFACIGRTGIALLGAAAFTTAAQAQFGASLQGTVTDTSGAVVDGATVTIVHQGTNTTKSMKSSSNGYYRFSELPAGQYTVDVNSTGFKKTTLSVAVAAETPASADIKLTLGGSNETVTVSSADSPLLQTSDASIGNTIDSKVIQRLPTFGRDPYETLRLTPGITGDGARDGSGGAIFLPNGGGPGGSSSGIFQTENQVQISSDGQRVADNNFLLDGVSVNSLGFGGSAVVTPNEEAVGSITVVSTSYSAQDGRNTGAQIKTVTKSGTNQFHGSVFFLYNEPGLNSFNKYGGYDGALPVRNQQKRRDWATSIGGPILKDKLFFFASYEGFSSLNNTYSPTWVVTPEFEALLNSTRANSVSSSVVNAPGGAPRILTALNATCTSPFDLGTPCQQVGDGLDIGGPQGGTGIYVPQDQNVHGSGVLDGIPDIRYVQASTPSTSRGNQFNFRGDWYITPRDQVSGIVYFTKLDSNGGTYRSNTDVPFKPLNSAISVIYIHTFSPSLLNEARANFTRFADNGITDARGQVNFGTPYINIQDVPIGGATFNYGVTQGSTTPAVFAENTYEVRDTVTKTFGSHTLAFGGEIRWEQDNNNLSGAARPVYAFSGIWNFFNSAPIFEGIEANPNTGGVPNAQRYYRDQYYGVFIQHDWKATPRLTINTGLRWEQFTPPNNKGFRVNQPLFGPTADTFLTAAVLAPTNRFFNPNYDNYSPKVGFAYTPPGTENTVIRGGFGIAYNRLPLALFDPSVENGPDIANYGLCCGTSDTPFSSGQIQYGLGSSSSPFSYAPNPALATGTDPATGFPRGFDGNPTPIEVYGAFSRTKTPMSFLYSLEVQQQFWKQWSITAGYQGSTGRHYTRLVNQNFLYANTTGEANTLLTAAYIPQNDSNQYYSAGNVTLSKRLSNGFTVNANYSWSKALDQVTNGDSANSSGNQTNPAHNETELGPSDSDTRHRFTAFALWDLPKLKSGNALLMGAANGWQVNGIFTYHTGFPFTPVTSKLNTEAPVSSAQTLSPVRPIGYTGPQHLTTCSNDAFKTGSWINSSDFVVTNDTANYQPGIGRNSFRGPCYLSTDMSVAKETTFPWFHGETSSLQFQANFFNIFNKLNLTPIQNGNGDPGAQIDSANFGRSSSATQGRVVEFYGRFRF